VGRCLGEGIGYRERLLYSSATPTAAPAADQPTALSWPLVRSSLTLQAPYLLAHTFDTTSVGRYKDEKKGINHVVVKMDLEDMKDKLMQSQELNSQMRECVRKNADRAFERLDKEE
jgi:hypothetical protein